MKLDWRIKICQELRIMNLKQAEDIFLNEVEVLKSCKLWYFKDVGKTWYLAQIFI